MTPQQPSPYRCETCKNKPCPALEIVQKKPYSDKFGTNYWWDKAGLVSSLVGCASHSDLQNLVAELVNKNILLVDAERNIVCIYNPGLFDRYNPLGMVGNRDAEGIRRGGLGRPDNEDKR